MTETCSITVIGDGVVGKTCLLYRYVQNISPNDLPYVPTVFENYAETLNYQGTDVNLQLWDTAGQEEYERLRVLAYERSDVFFLCYNVNNPTTLYNCKTYWMKELRTYKKNPIVILVGTQFDLVEDHDRVTTEAQLTVKEIKADDFFFTSAVTGEGVRELIYQAVRIKLKRSKRSCLIL